MTGFLSVRRRERTYRTAKDQPSGRFVLRKNCYTDVYTFHCSIVTDRPKQTRSNASALSNGTDMAAFLSRGNVAILLTKSERSGHQNSKVS